MRKPLGAIHVLVLGLAACAPTGAKTSPPAADKPAEDTQQTFSDAPMGTVEEQVAKGAKTFDEKCDGCHGTRGEGKEIVPEAPQIIGPGVLASHDFENAREVFDYVSTKMPADEPGELTPEQYWDVVAYLLYGSDVPLPEPLGPQNAASVPLEGAPASGAAL